MMAKEDLSTSGSPSQAVDASLGQRPSAPARPGAPRPWLRITIFYVLFASVWIGLSDQILGLIVDPAEATALQTVKGLAFVACTGLILFVLFRRDFLALRRALDQEQAARAGAEAAAVALRGSEQALKESEGRYRTLVEGSVQGILIHDHVTIRFANPAAARILGYSSPDDLRGQAVRSHVAPHELSLLDHLRDARLRGEPVPTQYELEGRRRDGAPIWVQTVVSVVSWEGQGAILATIIDITDRKRLEEQFRHSQKMEAVGRLAGGVAHDFNNLLTVITGRLEILEHRLEDPRVRRHAEIARSAGRRAATLTQQLLAFSRRQVLQPRPVDLNAILVDMESLLRQLVGEDLELRLVLDPGVSAILADPGQLEQVIMNLAVNSRDAMEQGGRLTLSTSTVDVQEGAVSVDLPAGRYVVLAVSDTGVGMDAATQARVFEPFFTTKPPGQGTGLGLSTAYGIIRQSGGDLVFESEPGRGTTFSIYLPVAGAGVTADGGAVRVGDGDPRGTETILLVEDEDGVRGLAREVLEARGYTVLEVAEPARAIELAARHPQPIDLLLTDVVMPQLSGRELAEGLARVLRDLKVLYMSGYTADMLGNQGVLAPGTAFIQKPFSSAGLARKVREVLDA